jgi:hypothetical protein
VAAATSRPGDHDPEGVMYVAAPDEEPIAGEISAADVAAVIARSVGLGPGPVEASERSSRADCRCHSKLFHQRIKRPSRSDRVA